MADEPEGSGFKVKDRRMFNPDGSPRGSGSDEAAEPTAATPFIGSAPAPSPKGGPGPRPGSAGRQAGPAPAPAREPARAERVEEDEDDHAASHQGNAPGEPGSIDFSQFVMSMAQIAAAYLGDIPNPGTGRPTLNVAAAKQQIDLLGMLEEKTRGNLTLEERELLKAILTELRLRFVEVREAIARAQAPRAR